jgi:hypothetical protein
MVGFLAAFAFFWLLVLSYLSYMLVRGHERERHKYEELVIPCLVLAWINILVLLGYWVISSLFFNS